MTRTEATPCQTCHDQTRPLRSMSTGATCENLVVVCAVCAAQLEAAGYQDA